MNTLHPTGLAPAGLARRHWLIAAAAGSLSGLAAWPSWGRAASGPLPIPLAEDAPPDIDPAGHLVSEKFDGVRAVWDGARLRFRSGLPLVAPRWFLDTLPPEPLDGELWTGRGEFERVSGTVRRAVPDDAAWRAVRYQVFDLPAVPGGFAERAARLERLAVGWRGTPLAAIAQWRLPDRAALQHRLREVLAAGGEGLMLRHEDSPYAAGRSRAMLKLKPLQDAEAVVIGHEPGRGKHAGRLGALRVRSGDGRVFRLGTGFSDAEREAPPPLGARVTYSHNGVTADGLPRFARFLRIRPDGV
jgi:DNA ligase-1